VDVFVDTLIKEKRLFFELSDFTQKSLHYLFWLTGDYLNGSPSSELSNFIWWLMLGSGITVQ
jgi:hypothetical protein